MVWPLALAAIASAGISYLGAERTNSSNRKMASAQMAFQDSQNDLSYDRSRDEATRSMEYEDWQRREQQAFQSGAINQQQDFQKETMATAMDYNTRMSNTSYQRGVQDMKQAGINPLLAFQQGGATAPQVSAQSGSSGTGARGSGAMGSRPSSSGSTAQMGNSLGAAVSGASQVAQLMLSLEQARENINQTKANTALTGEQQLQVRTNTALDASRAITEGVRPDLIRAQTRTEEGKPAALGASTARDVASARQLGAQTVTERERPEQARAESGRAIEQGNLAREQRRNSERYGPSGNLIGGAVGGAAAIGDSIGNFFRRILD